MLKPRDRNSFFQGYLAAAEAFAVWRDGDQWLGCGNHTLKQLKEVVKRFVEPKDKPRRKISDCTLKEIADLLDYEY